ncbi:YbdK family carboxylate-amine ligase [Patulibacter sp. SYSU D01012]|uniref:carboxylate-amine ligase n=1 Tax=Patulibacter sp. SYSU D01012 TaxID=2817381 RepID=UPI001B30766B|nr:YbdK family carboxylate-amine ligase [Patulibacter sp. SYSU D01012]
MSGEVTKEATGADWAAWPERSRAASFTLGVEEELMLLSPGGWNLAQAADEVLPRLPEDLRTKVCPETHAAALEIETGVARTVGDAARELRCLRDAVKETVAPLDLAVASSGTHPFAVWRETALGGGDRQAEVYGSMRELARREPTYALHVHVALPDADAAVDVFNRMRVHLPLLLALSGNSPFWQGRDTGLASARTPLFQAFPRVGIPRRFDSYEEWVGAVDLLTGCEAFPDATYLWWDVRMVPRYGTLEIRIMDAQIDLEATASLVALVQCLARMELEEAWAEEASHAPQEVWEENRFVAARDGADARLIVATEGRRVPVADRVDELLPHLRPHAQDLGCADELEGVCALVHGQNGQRRQLELARGDDRLPGLVRGLADAY